MHVGVEPFEVGGGVGAAEAHPRGFRNLAVEVGELGVARLAADGDLHEVWSPAGELGQQVEAPAAADRAVPADPPGGARRARGRLGRPGRPRLEQLVLDQLYRNPKLASEPLTRLEIGGEEGGRADDQPVGPAHQATLQAAQESAGQAVRQHQPVHVEAFIDQACRRPMKGPGEAREQQHLEIARHDHVGAAQDRAPAGGPRRLGRELGHALAELGVVRPPQVHQRLQALDRRQGLAPAEAEQRHLRAPRTEHPHPLGHRRIGEVVNEIGDLDHLSPFRRRNGEASGSQTRARPFGRRDLC